MKRSRIILACIIWIHAIGAGILAHYQIPEVAFPVAAIAIALLLSAPLFTETP